MDQTAPASREASPVYVNASLTNYGVIRKIMPVTGPGPITFGLAGDDSSGEWLTAEVADPGTLMSIQIDRIDRDHPHATHMTGRYWTITPTGSGTISLTLPRSLADPAHARVCRYETSWDCRADGLHGQHRHAQHHHPHIALRLGGGR